MSIAGNVAMRRSERVGYPIGSTEVTSMRSLATAWPGAAVTLQSCKERRR